MLARIELVRNCDVLSIDGMVAMPPPPPEVEMYPRPTTVEVNCVVLTEFPPVMLEIDKYFVTTVWVES